MGEVPELAEEGRGAPARREQRQWGQGDNNPASLPMSAESREGMEGGVEARK